ncbi:MAG: antitoxin Xre/MbcA/ParS toxin-binding domain-containing protein [Terracidiphilus sp.]
MASLPQFEREGIHPSATQPGKPEALSPLIRDKDSAGPARRMKRYRILVARVVDVFGDELKASRWLSLPNRELDGQIPIQVAEKDGYSLKSIEPLLIRIEHGVYD